MVGPDLDRVVTVWSKGRGQDGVVGTGFLCSDDRVLTARHVVGEAEDGRVEVRLLRGKHWLPAYVESEVPSEAADLDVAVLRLAAPLRPPGARPAPRWGRVGDSSSIRVIGVGFPRASARGDQRDTGYIEGWLHPAHEALAFSRGRATLMLDSNSFTPARQSRSERTTPLGEPKDAASPWNGASGAALFAEHSGQLIGVVTDDYRHDFGTRDVADLLSFALVGAVPGLAESVGVPIGPVESDRRRNSSPSTVTVNNNYNNHQISADPLDKLANELAGKVLDEWQGEADLRRLKDDSLPVRWELSTRQVANRAIGATAESGHVGFYALPGLQSVTVDDLKRGGGRPELHKVYGGLASGRLLLIGDQAVGKSSAAVMLVIDALMYRRGAEDRHRRRIPVPVIFDLHDWDPEEDVTGWVADRLAHRYLHGRHGRERARELLANDRVAVILDGLDEVNSKLRTAIIDALEGARFRLVLISRPSEAVKVARQKRLTGAVALEIKPVDSRDAAAYLLRGLPDGTPPDWQSVIDRLVTAPDSALAKALKTPLMLSLLRETYTAEDHPPVNELLDPDRFRTSAAVEEHLLDGIIKALYRRTGRWRSRYSPETAERTLRFIAGQLTRDRTHDLKWWHISGWASPKPRAMLLASVAVVVETIVWSIAAFSLPFGGQWWGVVLGFACGPMAGLLVYDKTRDREVPQHLPSAGRRDILNWATIRIGLLFFLIVSSIDGFSTRLLGVTYPIWTFLCQGAGAGIGAMLLAGRGYELFLGATREAWATRFESYRENSLPPAVVDSKSVSPRQAWRHHARLMLLLALAVGAVGVSLPLDLAPIVAHDYGLAWAVLLALSIAVPVLILAGLVNNLAVAAAMTAVQLRITEGTPIRLVAFLEDARRRNLLRTVGPVYQFRHALLEERLAQAGASKSKQSGGRNRPPRQPEP